MPRSPDLALVPRFGITERTLHWVHAAGFTGMLSSGMVLFLPALSTGIGSRPTVKAAHLGISAAWLTLVLVVSLGGDRRALRQTRRDLEAFDAEDARWLRRKPARSGRFNAGQKSHAIMQAALAVLFVVSGALLWLGERDRAFQLPGALPLHDAATLIGILLVAGHLFLALVWPATRPALRGIVRGTVRADWARRHHAAWEPGPESGAGTRSSGGLASGRRRVATVALLALGVAGTVAITRHTLSDGTPVFAQPATAANAAAAAAPPTEGPLTDGGAEQSGAQGAAPSDADVLLQQAQALDQAQRAEEALVFYRRAADADKARADLRTAYGFALARSGDLRASRIELREAIALDATYAPARYYLGAVLREDGQRKAGNRELRRVIELDPGSEGATLARTMLDQP